MTVLIIAPYKYSYLLPYLLISFLLINIYCSSVEKHVQTTWCELNFLLEGLECYKDAQN